VDLAFDLDAKLGERSLGGERVGDVAESVLVNVEAAILGHVDAPVNDVMAVMIARREAQRLDHAAGRRVVTVAGLMRNPDTHVRMISGVRRCETWDFGLPNRAR